MEIIGRTEEMTQLNRYAAFFFAEREIEIQKVAVN